MTIELLKISHFRNIDDITIDCTPGFNLFYGDNGAGKTSILETINYLSFARSFRTHLHDKLINDNRDYFVIFSKIKNNNISIPLGVQKSRDASIIAHLNESRVKSILEISRFLPIQFVGSNSYRILTDGPKLRRQFFDWGLFYTNPNFYTVWKRFLHVLTQRNAALKARSLKKDVFIWNPEFIELCNMLHLQRKTYFESLTPFFNQIISVWLHSMPIQLSYYPGWDDSLQLSNCLENHFSREIQLGHTIFGPHRADLLILHGNNLAQDILSQGQQKLVSYALRLAQGLHYHAATNKHPVYLIDDLPSELDKNKMELVVSILRKMNSQVFITGIHKEDLVLIGSADSQHDRMFHVKHGNVSPCVHEQCFT